MVGKIVGTAAYLSVIACIWLLRRVDVRGFAASHRAVPATDNFVPSID